jgi:putative tricarboxylic transport membrane protein
VAVLIGFYSVIEVLKVAEDYNPEPLKKVTYRMRGFDLTLKDMKEQAGNFFISAFIGAGIGFLPGIGSGTASMLSYSVAKNRSKYPEKFGTGILDGVVASETANNAVIGGALIPLLTLGIPGDSSTALLLAGFMIHGVTPGPLLFTTHAQLIYTMFACLIVGNILMVVFEYLALPVFLKLLNIPKHMLLTIIMVLCSIGAFAINNRIFDISSILLFALAGYAFYIFKYPVAPFIMGFILCPIVEKHLMRGLMLTKGDFIPFLSRPISAFFLVCMIIFIVFTVNKQLRLSLRRKK